MECLLVNMQIIFLGTNLSHLLSTRCLSSGRRWCGNPSSAVAVRKLCLIPSSCWWFFHRHFHIPHALWVKKSLHHFCSLTGTELSKVHEGLSLHPSPDLGCRGLLAILFVRLCLLRALDCSTHTRTNANYYFFKRFFSL